MPLHVHPVPPDPVPASGKPQRNAPHRRQPAAPPYRRRQCRSVRAARVGTWLLATGRARPHPRAGAGRPKKRIIGKIPRFRPRWRWAARRASYGRDHAAQAKAVGMARPPSGRASTRPTVGVPQNLTVPRLPLVAGHLVSRPGGLKVTASQSCGRISLARGRAPVPGHVGAPSRESNAMSAVHGLADAGKKGLPPRCCRKTTRIGLQTPCDCPVAAQ